MLLLVFFIFFFCKKIFCCFFFFIFFVLNYKRKKHNFGGNPKINYCSNHETKSPCVDIIMEVCYIVWERLVQEKRVENIINSQVTFSVFQFDYIWVFFFMLLILELHSYFRVNIWRMMVLGFHNINSLVYYCSTSQDIFRGSYGVCFNSLKVFE